jgi:RNA polymerase sigma factor (sigma-70 family)
MKIIFEFSDGTKSEVEVSGRIAEGYCISLGYDPENAPEIIVILDGEEKQNRKHSRPHKYTGIPVSLEEIAENGAETAANRNGYDEVETALDLERALATLTELQRLCFVEVELNGRTQQSVADHLGVSRESVKQAVFGAKKKLKKYF